MADYLNYITKMARGTCFAKDFEIFVTYVILKFIFTNGLLHDIIF